MTDWVPVGSWRDNYIVEYSLLELTKLAPTAKSIRAEMKEEQDNLPGFLEIAPGQQQYRIGGSTE